MLVNSGSAHCGESDQFEGGGNTLRLAVADPIELINRLLRIRSKDLLRRVFVRRVLRQHRLSNIALLLTPIEF